MNDKTTNSLLEKFAHRRVEKLMDKLGKKADSQLEKYIDSFELPDLTANIERARQYVHSPQYARRFECRLYENTEQVLLNHAAAKFMETPEAQEFTTNFVTALVTMIEPDNIPSIAKAFGQAMAMVFEDIAVVGLESMKETKEGDAR